MSVPAVKFNSKDKPEFIQALRSKVSKHFKEKNISKHANTKMKIKTVFMITLYFTPLVLMLTGGVTGLWPVMAMWFLMGMGMSGIGLAIMHDANHGSYSKNQRVNKALGFLVNFLGAYHVNWKIQHNVLHHSFTNIHDHDEDIAKNSMRFSPNQKRKKIFFFQLYYAPFLYGLMTLNWFVIKDIMNIFKYDKMNLLEKQGLTKWQAFRDVVFHKLWYAALTLALPILLVDLPWWQLVLGFLGMQFVAGLFLALVFQPAHVIEETNFYKTKDDGSVENSFAVHQLRTTANFANNSRMLSWFVGGLNFQIEHHLFPYICHVHYKEISKYVKETAKEYDLPYHQHRTFLGALKSHFTLLHQLGTGKYDRLQLAKVHAS